jgi:hypothetical protein
VLVLSGGVARRRRVLRARCRSRSLGGVVMAPPSTHGEGLQGNQEASEGPRRSARPGRHRVRGSAAERRSVAPRRRGRRPSPPGRAGYGSDAARSGPVTTARQPPHRRAAPGRDGQPPATSGGSVVAKRPTSAHGALSSATGGHRPEGQPSTTPGLTVVLPLASPRLTPDATGALLRLLLHAAEPARPSLAAGRPDRTSTGAGTREGRTSGDREDGPDETRRAA